MFFVKDEEYARTFSNERAAELLTLFLGSVEVSGVALPTGAHENVVALAATDVGQYVLRVSTMPRSSSVYSAARLLVQNEVRYVEALASRGVPVASFVRTTDGQVCVEE